jgi:hypothetical protein
MKDNIGVDSHPRLKGRTTAAARTRDGCDSKRTSTPTSRVSVPSRRITTGVSHWMAAAYSGTHVVLECSLRLRDRFRLRVLQHSASGAGILDALPCSKDALPCSK